MDWNAYDHILFLVVLVAAYSFTYWKQVLWLVTIFTIGHTLALFLSVYEIVIVSSKWVEFLIPITILVTAIYNIMTAKKKESQKNHGLLYFTTAFFGVIHGLGFSYYFIRIVPNDKFLPLLEFALGIEAAQVIVVITVMILGFIFQNMLKTNRRDWILIVSSIVIGVILPILRENFLSL